MTGAYFTRFMPKAKPKIDAGKMEAKNQESAPGTGF